MEPINKRQRPKAKLFRYERDFVVADPHHVYYDAVMHSPWNHDSGGHLPQRDEWSTYRYTVKDIILGIATHRFNKNTRRLEIRAYFIGEHPLFRELEPTRAMLTVLFCQSYQSGGSLDIFFEHGIPFDIRLLIEQTVSCFLSGHDQLIPGEVGSKVFAALSSLSPEIQDRIAAQNVDIDAVCYNTYRGTWLPNHIRSLLQNGIPLRWIFKSRPDPLGNSLVYSHLITHVKAALLTEYAVRRLEDRQMGESLSKVIHRVDDGQHALYRSSEDINITDEESTIRVAAESPFCLIPIMPKSTGSLASELPRDLRRAYAAAESGTPILVVPLDYIYLDEHLREKYYRAITENGFQLAVVGLTASQLLAEAEINLSITAAQADPDEVDMINVDRYPD